MVLNMKKQEILEKASGKKRLTIDELKIIYGEPEDFMEEQ